MKFQISWGDLSTKKRELIFWTVASTLRNDAQWVKENMEEATNKVQGDIQDGGTDATDMDRCVNYEFESLLEKEVQSRVGKIIGEVEI